MWAVGGLLGDGRGQGYVAPHLLNYWAGGGGGARCWPPVPTPMGFILAFICKPQVLYIIVKKMTTK